MLNDTLCKECGFQCRKLSSGFRSLIVTVYLNLQWKWNGHCSLWSSSSKYALHSLFCEKGDEK